MSESTQVMPDQSDMPPSHAVRSTARGVSLIICAYTLDRWQDLIEAVASARAMTMPPSEIILVCDHNVELFDKMRVAFPDHVVVSNEEVRGLSGARNTGVRHANGGLIAFLDDDAIASTDWLSSLVRNFSESGVCGVMSRIEPLWIGQRPGWLPSEFLWTVGCSYTGMPGSTSEVRNLMGAGMCFKREVFDVAGGFTHRLGRTGIKLPLSCEETEFCIRARQALSGAKFIFDPASAVWHKVPAQRLTLRYFLLRCYAEGISKQRLASMFQSKTALTAEASYAVQTLPRGVIREISGALWHGDFWGLARAGAIVLGLLAAAAGYSIGSIPNFARFRGRVSPSRGVVASVNGTQKGQP